MIIWVLSLGRIVDTVIMNPPFGTRKKGADLDFLSVALKVSNSIKLIYKYMIVGNSNITFCEVASQAIYSLKKTSTRDVSHFYFKF